jgi:hypothetical protein
VALRGVVGHGREWLELSLGGSRTVRVGGPGANHPGSVPGRLEYELGPWVLWDNVQPLTTADTTDLVRLLLDHGQSSSLETYIYRVPPAVADAFPGDLRLFVHPVPPMVVELPAERSTVAIDMDADGFAHVSVVSDTHRRELGADGSYATVDRLLGAMDGAVDRPRRVTVLSDFVTVPPALPSSARSRQVLSSFDGSVLTLTVQELEAGWPAEVVLEVRLSRSDRAAWTRSLSDARTALLACRVHHLRGEGAQGAQSYLEALERRRAAGID